jgi:hypothetical protein
MQKLPERLSALADATTLLAIIAFIALATWLSGFDSTRVRSSGTGRSFQNGSAEKIDFRFCPWRIRIAEPSASSLQQFVEQPRHRVGGFPEIFH